MGSQEGSVHASFSAGSEPSPIGDISQNQSVHPYILAALDKDSKNQLYIMELGNVFEAFIPGQRAFMSFSPPPFPSHCRQLAIFCAIYYNLMPEHDFVTGGLLVFKTASSRIPPIRLFDLAHPERIPPPLVRDQGWEEQPMVRAVIKQPWQLNIQTSDQLDVPDPQTFPPTPPQTSLPATNHFPPSPNNPTHPSSTLPQKANPTIIITSPTGITLSSETPSIAPSTNVGIKIRTCGRPLNPNAPPFVPAHLGPRIIVIHQPTLTPGIRISSSTGRTRIDARFLPDWRSLSTAGHGGLDYALHSRRKSLAGSSSSMSGSETSPNLIDWGSPIYSGANSP